MTDEEYKAKVVSLFMGKATNEMYVEMATAVHRASLENTEAVDAIDTAILGKLLTCKRCGSWYREKEVHCQVCDPGLD